MNTIVDNAIGIFCIFISLVIIVFLLIFRKKSKNKKVDNWFIFLFLIMIGLCLVMIYQNSKFSRQASSDIYLVEKMQVEINIFKNYEKRIPKVSEMYLNKIIPEKNMITVDKVNKLVSSYKNTPIDIGDKDNQILLNYSIADDSGRAYVYCLNMANRVSDNIEGVDIIINDKVINKSNVDNVEEICKKDSSNTYSIILK